MQLLAVMPRWGQGSWEQLPAGSDCLCCLGEPHTGNTALGLGQSWGGSLPLGRALPSGGMQGWGAQGMDGRAVTGRVTALPLEAGRGQPYPAHARGCQSTGMASRHQASDPRGK